MPKRFTDKPVASHLPGRSAEETAARGAVKRDREKLFPETVQSSLRSSGPVRKVRGTSKSPRRSK